MSNRSKKSDWPVILGGLAISGAGLGYHLIWGGGEDLEYKAEAVAEAPAQPHRTVNGNNVQLHYGKNITGSSVDQTYETSLDEEILRNRVIGIIETDNREALEKRGRKAFTLKELAQIDAATDNKEITENLGYLTKNEIKALLKRHYRGELKIAFDETPVKPAVKPSDDDYRSRERRAEEASDALWNLARQRYHDAKQKQNRAYQAKVALDRQHQLYQMQCARNNR